MHQHCTTRKIDKHYLSCVVSNKTGRDLYNSVNVTLCVIYSALRGFCVAQRHSVVAYRGRRLNLGRIKAVLNQLFGELTRWEKGGRSGIHAVADQRRCLIQVRCSPCSSYFTSSETPRWRQAAPATARCRCGRSPLPCPPSKRSFAPPAKAAASPTAAAPGCRLPAS